MTSKIQQELAKATEIEPGRGESIKDEQYQKSLMRGVSKLNDDAWDKLSDEAQDWFNKSAEAVKKAGSPLPWPDLKEDADEAAPRRRRASADEEPAATLKKPAKGDKVVVTTKKGNKYEGTVVDPDDKGELVLDDGKEEIGLKYESIESIVGPAAAEEAPRRRRAAAEEEPPARGEPEVGDDVELKTKRGTIKVGKIIEINDKIVVLKDTVGDEVEFDKDRVESITVKLKAQKEEGGRRRRASEDDGKASASKDDGKAGGDEASGRDSSGIGEKARAMVLDDLKLSKDDFVKAMIKAHPSAKENTLKLVYSEVHKIVGMMRERKMLK